MLVDQARREDVPLRYDDTWLWHDDDADGTDYSDDVAGESDSVLWSSSLHRWRWWSLLTRDSSDK